MPREKQYRDELAIKKVGQNIRDIRTKKGLSQEKLAYLCGMELSQINRIELGKINTSVSYIFLIAEKLGVQPSELIK